MRGKSLNFEQNIFFLNNKCSIFATKPSYKIRHTLEMMMLLLVMFLDSLVVKRNDIVSSLDCLQKPKFLATNLTKSLILMFFLHFNY